MREDIKKGWCLYCGRKCNGWRYYHVECLEKEWNKLMKDMGFNKNKQENKMIMDYIAGIKKAFELNHK